MERLGANLDNTWPSKNAMGTALFGRIPMAASAGTCCIVAHQEPLDPGRLTLPRPPEEHLAEFRELAHAGKLGLTVIGSFSDGAIALIDLRADPSLAALPEATA